MQVKFSFLIDQELRRKAKIKAAKTGKPMAAVCREALRTFVENRREAVRRPAKGEVSGQVDSGGS